MPHDPARAIEAVWRLQAVRIIAAVARLVRDVGLAEEAAQDALVAALEQWPQTGIPRNPGAWLTAAAKRRAIDQLRRRARFARREPMLAHAQAARQADDAVALDRALEDDVGDDLLRLVFCACHPVLPPEARAALTLRLLCGLTTAEIARAYLVPEATVAQRIVRAKRALRAARVPFAMPSAAARAERLASVLEVVYLIFNEGYAATGGEFWLRPTLCDEALRLARVLAGLAPDDAEVLGLTALLELQASRLRARVDAGGRPVRLEFQNRATWDRLLIRRGLAALERARALTDAPGPYLLQAAIAACHARAESFERTDWPLVASLYAELARLTGSPVVELNRAVAAGMAWGPQAGLALVDALDAAPALRQYHLLPAVRGDLLARLGRREEAAACFARAAGLTRNLRERELLLERARACTVSAD